MTNTIDAIGQTRLRILLVGGGSNPGMAFRRIVADRGCMELVVLTRKPIPMLGSERLVVIEDYFSPDVSVFDGIDVVVNVAGIVRGTPEELHAVNVAGVSSLGALAKRCGVRHFVQISSLSVYGAAEVIELTTPERPISDYGRSKLAGDVTLLSLADMDFAVTSLRCPTFYGEGIDSKLRRLAGMMLRLGWFPVPSVLNKRSILHLDNLAEALFAVVLGRRIGIQFAADPEEFDLAVLANTAESRAARPVRLVRLPQAVFALLRIAAQGIYSSLYGRSVIRAPLVPISGRPQIETLAELFVPQTRKTPGVCPRAPSIPDDQ